jgi:hypothetical protein
MVLYVVAAGVSHTGGLDWYELELELIISR